MNEPLTYYCDDKRHLVCLPYSVDNLHRMARALRVHPCWYHGGDKPHYDVPKTRTAEIKTQCNVVSSRRILQIIQTGL